MGTVSMSRKWLQSHLCDGPIMRQGLSASDFWAQLWAISADSKTCFLGDASLFVWALMTPSF